ncbi:MAG: MBL fold metallo-hydrolase [Clostridia bacterium]|nr:MBL fold metallo-hydrolase [Clostridia bacterium]
MRIISLAENTSRRDDIRSEHGLSLYIEACGKKILFDMGQSDIFYDNALALGVDISSVDIAIISHGHYDHGGGLKRFLEINGSAPIYIRRTATLPYYNGERYIGLDPTLTDCDRLIFTDGELSVCEGIRLVSIDSAPDDVGEMKLRVGDRFIPDSFNHEQYLLIEEGERRTLISGCSHKGIIAIAEHFKPNVLIGGFHFMNMETGDELKERAERLDAIDCDYYTCHCTGVLQYEYLTKYIKRIKYLSAGDSIEI